jgi:hypothetical protein
MNIRIPTRVLKLEEKKRTLTGRKKEDGEVIFTHQTLGWFVRFEGSDESLFIGFEKPEDLAEGTEVDILIIPKKPHP